MFDISFEMDGMKFHIQYADSMEMVQAMMPNIRKKYGNDTRIVIELAE